jgi:quercetin 2,3-dioxygenase
MTNRESNPVEQWCSGGQAAAATAERPVVEVLGAREVPLGGPRAMTVRRTLPQRRRSLIGAWCFADHYGPEDVAVTGGMDVPPHPHTGLQTVSWLFTGQIEHRDSSGVHATIRPGEVNLMTGGRGICHSEVSTPGTTVLHGVQLWIARPDKDRHTARNFEHHVPAPVALDGAVARVFLGRLAGCTSPVATFTPLLGAEIVVDGGATTTLDVDPGFEHGVLVDRGIVTVSDTSLRRGELGYVGPGPSALTVTNSDAGPARVILLGGEPFGEEILMWWNFVGRAHDEIVAYREAWEAPQFDKSDQFGRVDGYAGQVQRLPAPVLPNVTIKPRRNPGR